MDLLPEAVEYVTSLGLWCECALSIDDLKISKNSLDIVTVLGCNYYWPQQTKELRAIHSLLGPEGLLVMRTVDTSWELQLGLWLRRWFPETGRRLCKYVDYDHRVLIPIQSLLKIVRREEFEIIYASPYDALDLRHNNFKTKIAYMIGEFVWRLMHYNLAPGFVFIARKQTP